MYRPGHLITFALCCLLSACSDCDASAAPTRTEATAKPPELEAQPPAYPPPQGTPLSTDALAPLVPESIGDFARSGVVEPQSRKIGNGGTITTVRSAYLHDADELQLEISDALHAPPLIALIKKQQGTNTLTSKSSYDGVAVAGFPAIVQWQAATHTAFANLLVGDRLIVNLRLKPANSADAVIALAANLPLQEALKLARASEQPREQPAASAVAAPTAATLNKPNAAAPPSAR